MLNPTSSGMVALHCDVPEAVPDCPKLFDHVTDATLPPAVPVKTIEVADVETDVDPGDVMASVSDPPEPPVCPPPLPLPPPDCGGEPALCRVIEMD